MTPEQFRAIISKAIENEVEAYTYYRTTSEKVKDAYLKKIFADLAGDEKGHREFLQGLLTMEPKRLNIAASKDYKIAESVATPPLSADLKPIDGIVLAIKKELMATSRIWQPWNEATKPVSKTSTQTWHFPNPGKGNHLFFFSLSN